MKTFALTTALVLTLAAPALASDQLARSLGVEPGTLTTSQLVGLQSAYAEDDAFRANQILKSAGSDGFVASTKSGISAGHAQLAASLGVDANDFSKSDLIGLRSAENEDDAHRAKVIRSSAGNGNFVASSKSGVSAGHAQLAASVGVDPTVYSYSDVIGLRSAIEEDDAYRYNFILDNPTN